jgi:DNA-binding NarL/FixJ family response regulator
LKKEVLVSIRILLADDHKLVRHGLRAALEQAKGMEVVAEAANGEEALELCRQHEPQVVLMDINMPGINGTEATRRIMEELPKTKVLALTMYDQERYVRGMLEAGAVGYLLKNCAFEELSEAIEAAVKGQSRLSREITGAVIGMAVQPGAGGKGPGADVLSKREREVVGLVAAGLTSKDIGLSLGISENTVESHRRRVMKKLEISSVAELTKFAIREGLAGLDD